MLIAPTPGVTYAFTFVTDFASFNGIYTLVKLMTYDEYLSDGGDLFADLFNPVGLTNDQMEEDMATIRASKIMKLVTPEAVDTEIRTVFMPTCYAEDNPDHNVGKYLRIGVTAYIGVTKDVELLTFMKEALTEYITAATGIDPQPQFISVGETWLTDSQYEEIEASRDEAKKRIINYYSENVKLEKRIASLQEKLAAYEEIIVQQWKQLHPEDTSGTGG